MKHLKSIILSSENQKSVEVKFDTSEFEDELL